MPESTKSPAEVLGAGRNVFGHDGRRAEYVGPQGRYHLVRPIARFSTWDGDEIEEPTDALELWYRVYPSPPVPVISSEVAKMQAKVEEAKADLLETKQKIAEAQRGALATMKRIVRYEPLKNLESILDGTITHVVETGYSVAIRDFETAKVYRDDYERKNVLRMLSLKPTEDGEIRWHLNRWSDGSGPDTPVILCTSEDEAKEAAAAAILERLSRYDFSTHGHLWVAAAKNAAEMGIDLPHNVLAKATDFALYAAEREIEKANEALKAAKAKKAALRQASIRGGEA